MPSTFKDIKSALNAIKPKIKDIVQSALLSEVAQEVKETEVRHVYSDVYPRPHPNYTRRYGNGGLGDIENMHEYLENDGLTLAVAQDTPFNVPFANGVDDSLGYTQNSGEGLDGLVNYGQGWNGLSYDIYACDETMFIENTVEELRHTKKHIEAMKLGLKSRGLDVK